MLVKTEARDFGEPTDQWDMYTLSIQDIVKLCITAVSSSSSMGEHPTKDSDFLVVLSRNPLPSNLNDILLKGALHLSIVSCICVVLLNFSTLFQLNLRMYFFFLLVSLLVINCYQVLILQHYLLMYLKLLSAIVRLSLATLC